MKEGRKEGWNSLEGRKGGMEEQIFNNTKLTTGKKEEKGNELQYLNRQR